MIFCFALVVLIAMIPSAPAQSCHRLHVQLISWTGNGRHSGGSRCDNTFSGPRCDPIFHICVNDMYPTNSWSSLIMPCSYSGRIIEYGEFRGRNSYTFPNGTGVLGGGFSNPMRFDNLRRPWERARVYVKIMDHDHAEDDLIDYHTFNLNYKKAHSDWNYISLTDRGTNYPKTASVMKIRYIAKCCYGYYGSSCSVQCSPSYSWTGGFYTCHPSTGLKVCRAGFLYSYTTPPCVTRDCRSFRCFNGGTPRHTPGSYLCTCNCRPGFTGRRCLRRFHIPFPISIEPFKTISIPSED